MQQPAFRSVMHQTMVGVGKSHPSCHANSRKEGPLQVSKGSPWWDFKGGHLVRLSRKMCSSKPGRRWWA